ncbi:ras-specific guanine nucleotide-releasing factor 2 [Trichonephila inaurata madagascariensis]|uniref:Ras-specific guanine nucleotide-releasing factor 2 n=1 Tax=Trichonephila inaurata madagascariensis TaxID=2747483 RepID=A0A8X6WMD3_9ARAC|nr:ras-specific guanine nucleotide-releasing factor 2 [Trichonephila inaurata madagascariensis]
MFGPILCRDLAPEMRHGSITTRRNLNSSRSRGWIPVVQGQKGRSIASAGKVTASMFCDAKRILLCFSTLKKAEKLQAKPSWPSGHQISREKTKLRDEKNHFSQGNTHMNDPRLFKDDVDIRFSRTLNSCKLPQIRYASPERLFERLTDLRFLSIDFLNTFLLTYRVFTDGVTVLEALKKVHYAPEGQISASLQDSTGSIEVVEGIPGDLGTVVADYDYSRRISTVSTMSDIGDSRENMESSLAQIQQAQQMLVTRSQQHWRLSHRKCKRRIGVREDTPLDCKYITV